MMDLDTNKLFGELESVTPSIPGPHYHEALFYKTLLSCAACACRAEASRVVPGVGPKSARIIFVGRNPGRDEDERGLPFVGRGGGELDRMLETLGIDRAKIAILNVVKCHTLGDRPPKPIEIEICTNNWLQKELNFFEKAQIIFPMGREAVSLFLGATAESPGKREGYWVTVEGPDKRTFYICPLNHPGYILRARGKQIQMYNVTLPSVKERLEKDFREAYGNSKI